MRKVILLIAVLLSASIAVDAAQSSAKADSSVSASSSHGRRITVWKNVERAGVSSVAKTGVYYANRHELKVGGETYKVKMNPNFGRASVKFSNCKYCAGPYYFNLDD